MRELRAYENEDGTFRVDIRERVVYFVDNIKQQKDALIEVIDLLYANCCFIELTTEEWNELIK